MAAEKMTALPEPPSKPDKKAKKEKPAKPDKKAKKEKPAKPARGTKPEKPAKAAKPRFDARDLQLAEGVPDPPILLWETVLSVSQTLIVVAGLLVAFVAMMTGVAWWIVLIRSVSLVVVLSALAWIVNWMVASGTLATAQVQMRTYVENKEREEAEARAKAEAEALAAAEAQVQSTMEFEA